jgi:hypothetical protein
MSDHSIAHGRRRVLKLVAGGIVAVPLAKLLLSSPAHAAKTISPSDPLAKQIKYVENSPKKGQTCSNCRYYGGSGPTGPCSILQGKLVVAKGWSTAWAPA